MVPTLNVILKFCRQIFETLLTCGTVRGSHYDYRSPNRFCRLLGLLLHCGLLVPYARGRRR